MYAAVPCTSTANLAWCAQSMNVRQQPFGTLTKTPAPSPRMSGPATPATRWANEPGGASGPLHPSAEAVKEKANVTDTSYVSL